MLRNTLTLFKCLLSADWRASLALCYQVMATHHPIQDSFFRELNSTFKAGKLLYRTEMHFAIREASGLGLTPEQTSTAFSFICLVEKLIIIIA